MRWGLITCNTSKIWFAAAICRERYASIKWRFRCSNRDEDVYLQLAEKYIATVEHRKTLKNIVCLQGSKRWAIYMQRWEL